MSRRSVIGAVVAATCWSTPFVATAQDTDAPCVMSQDPTYAYTRENPVRIGGGAFTVAARERRYLDALRGPEGQELSYRRGGSSMGPDETILDIYSVTHQGLEEPITLYLDAYRWAEPEVPVGLTCGRPFNLPVPGPDPFGKAEDPRESAQRAARPPGRGARGAPDLGSLTEIEIALNELAVAYAREDRAITPIPLDPERPELGVALAPFHRKVLQARADVAAGRTPELPIEMGPGAGPPNGNTIVAYPLSCDGEEARPREIAYIGMTRPGQRGEVMATRAGLTGAALAEVLPGFEAPGGTLVTVFLPSTFNRDDEVVIRYGGAACAEIGEEVRLPVVVRLPRPIERVHAPDSVNVTNVRVRAIIDVDGVPHGATAVEGIPPLHEEAARLAGQWRWQPLTVNGVAVPMPIGYVIQFGAGTGRQAR